MKFRALQDLTLLKQIQNYTKGSATDTKKKLKYEDILIDGIKESHPATMVKTGSFIEVRPKVRSLDSHISVIFEDAYLIAVEKPTGILSSGYSQSDKSSLHVRVDQWLRTKSKNRERAFVVHRLDQKVSGILLFAKTEEVQFMLQEAWFTFEKYYHALVEGAPKKNSDTIESWLSENKNFKVFSGPKSQNSKLAITHYEVEQRFKNYSLLKVRLGTGKKNQIRVQLADIGCPIVGDLKYGANSNPIKRIGLHAYRFELTHPMTHEKLVLLAKTPQSFFMKT